MLPIGGWTNPQAKRFLSSEGGVLSADQTSFEFWILRVLALQIAFATH